MIKGQCDLDNFLLQLLLDAEEFKNLEIPEAKSLIQDIEMCCLKNNSLASSDATIVAQRSTQAFDFKFASVEKIELMNGKRTVPIRMHEFRSEGNQQILPSPQLFVRGSPTVTNLRNGPTSASVRREYNRRVGQCLHEQRLKTMGSNR